MTINEDSIKLAPARECCGACGREMKPEDYDAIHGTVLVSVTGKLGEVVIPGDSWTLLCADCYERFCEVFKDFKHERSIVGEMIRP